MHENSTANPFTTTAEMDGEQWPATPRRFFEAQDRGVLDVQTIICPAADGGPVVHIGDTVLTPASARALAAYLAEVLEVLP